MAHIRRTRSPSPEVAAFPSDRVRGRLSLDPARSALPSQVAATLLEMAAAAKGPFLAFSTSGRMSPAWRTARELGLEPRILTPAGGGGLAARSPLSLPLRSDIRSPPAKEALDYLSGALVQSLPTTGAGSAASATRVRTALERCATELGVGLTFAALADAMSAAFAGSPSSAKALRAQLTELHEAEVSATVFSTPLPWSRLLEPSPAGRRAAVLLDCSGLPAATASRVIGLSLASLAAAPSEWGGPLGATPLGILAEAPLDALGAGAVSLLLGERPPRPVFGLFLETPDTEGMALPGVVAASLHEGRLRLAGEGGDLSLLPAPSPLGALSVDEVRAMSPPALRERFLGALGIEEEGEPAQEGVLATGSRASAEALQQAAGDIDSLARKGLRPAKPRAAQRKGTYEAGDFEL